MIERLAGQIMLLTGWPRRLAGLLAGAVLALTLAPLDLVPAGFLAFPVLVWLMDGGTAPVGAGRLRRLAPAFGAGWWFGFGYFTAGLWWIGNALLVESEALIWALPLAVLGLPAVLAVFFGIGCALARLLWSSGPGRLFALAFGLMLAEILRAEVLTGFPWNPLGQTLASNVVFMQPAALVGVEGLAGVAVLAFSAPALLGDGRGRVLAFGLPVLLLGAVAAHGILRLPTIEPDAETLSVRIVQPAIAQNEKWDLDEANAIFAGLIDLSRGPALVTAGSATLETAQPATGSASDDAILAAASETPATDDQPRLIVWPETALPFLLEQRPDALTSLADALSSGQVLLTGGARVEGNPADPTARFYNSMIAVDSGGEIIAGTDKTHLVPFGEYLPLRSLLEPFGIDTIAHTPGIFAPGPAREPMDLGQGFPPILGLICYEAIFSREVLADVANARLLINVTNDAWYGRTPGPYQHFRQAQMRAIETGLPLVRAANNGLSGFVDPWGRISGGLALDVRGAVDHAVPLVQVATLFSTQAKAVLSGLLALFFVLALAFRLLFR